MKLLRKRSKEVFAIVAAISTILVLLGSSTVLGPVTGALPPYRSPPAFRPGASFRLASVTLPGFDPLYGYVFGDNCKPGPLIGCFEGGTNYSQVPVLSSDGSSPFGIYYVNNSSVLSEVELPSGSVRAVAPVTILSQSWALYGGMLANEFYIDTVYGEALFFGTLPSASRVSVETVNLTTGTVRMVRTTLTRTTTNQQASLIDPTHVLIISQTGGVGGEMYVVNMTTGFVAQAGSLSFFEANNIYWLPQKHQLINVEAEGSVGDRVQQWDENSSGSFYLVSTVIVDSGVAVDWVNGIAYDASTDSIAFSMGGLNVYRTYVLHYRRGLLSNENQTTYHGRERVLNIQRYTYASDWMMAGFVNNTQYVFDPWNGTVVPTNEPFTQIPKFDVCDGSCYLGQYAPSLSVLIDWNASVERNDPFWSVVVAAQPSW